MTIDVNELRPMNKDVIIRYHDYNKMSGDLIQIEDKSEEVNTHYCEVLRVAPSVKEVNPGDIVVVGWLNMTEPFLVEVDGIEQKVVITTEDRISGVVEDE